MVQVADLFVVLPIVLAAARPFTPLDPPTINADVQHGNDDQHNTHGQHKTDGQNGIHRQQHASKPEDVNTKPRFVTHVRQVPAHADRHMIDLFLKLASTETACVNAPEEQEQVTHLIEGRHRTFNTGVDMEMCERVTKMIEEMLDPDHEKWPRTENWDQGN